MNFKKIYTLELINELMYGDKKICAFRHRLHHREQ